MIYCVGAYLESGELYAVKIGHTKDDPGYRLQALQSGCPLELRLIGCADGDSADESAIHRDYRALVIRNEWFRPDGTIVACFSDGRLPPHKPVQRRVREDYVPTPLGERLHALRSGAGMTCRALAKKAGVANAHVNAIEVGRIKSPAFAGVT